MNLLPQTQMVKEKNSNYLKTNFECLNAHNGTDYVDELVNWEINQ
jgi:hypothetical protein